MRLISTIINDIKIQYRSGFYFAYLFVTLFYIAGIKQLPTDMQEAATFFVVITDPSVLGFYFIGGLILLEKRQEIFAALFVTTLSIGEYLVSKVLSLSLLSLGSSIVIVTAIRGLHYNIPLFTVVVFSSSVLFTLIGITLGTRAKDINRYLFISPLYLIVFAAPVLRLLLDFDQRLLFLIPTNGIFNLTYASLSGIPPYSWQFDIVGIGLWIVLSWIWSKNWFKRFIVESKG